MSPNGAARLAPPQDYLVPVWSGPVHLLRAVAEVEPANWEQGSLPTSLTPPDTYRGPPRPSAPSR